MRWIKYDSYITVSNLFSAPAAETRYVLKLVKRAITWSEVLFNQIKMSKIRNNWSEKSHNFRLIV